MKRTAQRLILGVFAASAVSVVALGPSVARADVCYDSAKNQIVVNPLALSVPFHCFSEFGGIMVIYPTGPAYVPAPTYGAYGTVGAGRRAGRRGARRYERRN
jgi:hypothetical protein